MPSGFNVPSSDTETVVGVQFGIFSPEEIERRSVVEITRSDAPWEGSEPKIGGLFDPRMGVLENGKTCRSCGLSNHGCPGHFGHYKLTRPVYWIQFLPTVLNVLRCVCIRCSKLLIEKDNHRDVLRRKGEDRWNTVKKHCIAIQRCGQDTEDGCGAPQPKSYIKEGIARIVAQMPGVGNQPLEIEYVLRLLRRITDEDVDFMGLSRFWCRPDWMVCTVLPIPPPQDRPSIVQDNNQRSEDDLTHKLFEIIKTDKTLAQKIENNATKTVIDEWTNVLQYHVATLVDNQIPGVAPSAQRSGRPLKSIQQRLGSKEGRIRYNIQGKRVEFSARSVITPDPNISIGELGVPLKIAMNLTYPDRVTTFNIDRLYKFIQNGADTYPGAKTISRQNGSMISLRHINTRELRLYPGDVVHRHLMDGDVVLFNRQPTLHRPSMMGHRVRVLPYNTFRLNVSVCKSYNADFDGDEMNMHVPQSYEASVELAEIAAVHQQIITPRDAKPLIGVEQDTLVGAYRITRPNNNFNLREFMNLMMWNRRFDGNMQAPRAGDAAAPKWTGHQVLTTIMPPINMNMPNSSFDDAQPQHEQIENTVHITEGNIEQGVFDKSIFSKASKGIIHTTYNDYGPKAAVEMIDCLQNTLEAYLVLYGFSVGISDLVADDDTKVQMDIKIQARKKEIEGVLLQIHQDLFDNNTGKSNQEEFESRVFAALNKATEEAGKIGQGSLAKENRITAMVRAGSKGGPINIAQMMACVGQQSVEGKRIPYGYTDRTLPHYKKYDDGAEARGFVESNFIRGLTPQEFFFHAMSGREGLIDTAVKTAETGYIQRQLIKGMEDLVIQHDGSVRDANGNVIQFHYGEDGTNSTRIESQSLALAKLTEKDIREKYGMREADLTGVLAEGVEREPDEDALAAFVEQVLTDRRMVVEGVFASGRQGGVFSPVNIERLMLNIKNRFALNAQTPTDLTPLYVLKGIERVIQRTQPYHKIWCALLRFNLAPHKLILAERYTKAAFEAMCELLVVKNWKSWSQPGELVGILAAQSIGEPSTQMSCVKDTVVSITNGSDFHYCGPIGKFIDEHLTAGAEKVQVIGEDSVVLDLDSDYYIVGVSENEKTSWRRISQISRHPANGGLVRVKTKSGRATTATLSHSFLKRTSKGIAPVLGSDLAIGDRIPVARSIPQAPGSLTVLKEGQTTLTLDYNLGWLAGIYLADGTTNGRTVRITKIHPVVEERIAALCTQYGWKYTTKYYEGEYGPSKDTVIESTDLRNFMLKHFGEGSYDKTVSGTIYHTCTSFITGIISGYFDGDGNINVERQQIRVGSRSAGLIKHIGRLLAYCGIFATFGEESSVRIPGKTMYTLNVLKKYASAFAATIGLQLPEKAAGLAQIIAYMDRTDKHDTKEMYDKIPAVGSLIAETGRLLKMPGQSRNYGRWMKKESIGRITLTQYVSDFKEMLAIKVDEEVRQTVDANIMTLESALAADVVWDEIVALEYLEDPKEFVYDFTVPGNDSFMVDDSILVHNTLNTFHLAGVASKSNVTRGVPRLRELLKVTPNPKATSLTICLKPEYREMKEKAREVSQELELTLLRDITSRVAIYYDPKDSNSVLPEDRDLLAFYTMFEATENEAKGVRDTKPWSPWLLRIELDREKMFNKNISMNDVGFVLRNRYQNVHFVYSDYNSQRLVMRMRVQLGGELDGLVNLKKFQNKVLNGIVIRGIPGIKSVAFRKDSEKLALVDGKYQAIEQFILDTDGSNYLEVMNHPAVDGNRLYSTNVHDVYEQLGVEAARAVLLQEITLLFDEVGLNYRHLGLLCDVMTHNGKLMSIDRYGINKSDIGPLAKASFEETEKILLKAALFGEVDPVTGVSANIMMGQPIRGGTAFTQILLDEQALPRLLEGLPPLRELEEESAGRNTEDLLEETLQDPNDPCAAPKFQMYTAMPLAEQRISEPDMELVVLEA